MDQIEDNNYYTFSKVTTDTALLFTWKHVPNLEIQIFKNAIQKFANLCQIHHPEMAVIDAGSLDQESPAVKWLRGQETDANDVIYDHWWLNEIVPIYNSSSVKRLSVATGDPNAPGEIDLGLEIIKFKIGYFPDLDVALTWQGE